LRERSFEFYSIVLFGAILCRYFVVAGVTHWVFYSAVSQSFINPRLRHRTPSREAIRHDIQLSVVSAVVFALAAALVLSAYHRGLTQLYLDPQQYGFWYLGASYGAVLLLQDTYFYFTHRLFHQPRWFAWLHRGHHRSRYPTPWTSFAFDPLEAVIQAVFLVGIVFVLPLHFITVIAVMTTMTVWAVLNHLGPDRLPAVFPHHWLGQWVIGPAHHSIHHLKFTVHYGLYFTFWDRLLNTQDPRYIQTLGEFAPDCVDKISS
jgi:Delta7-sterol 5-desaturase